MENAKHQSTNRQSTGLIALLGVGFGAVASLCCVVPLILVALGISGTWIGSLSAFAPLKPYALVLGAVALLWALYLVLKSRKPSCDDGTCETHSSPRLLAFIGLGALIWLIAATDALWAPLLA
jgi:mercuric ion transport protein